MLPCYIVVAESWLFLQIVFVISTALVYLCSLPRCVCN